MTPGDRGLTAGSLRLALLAVAACVACKGADGSRQSEPSTDPIHVPRFDGAAAYELVKRQVNFGHRIPGTAAHAAMADWMEGYLSERADTVMTQRFDHVSVDGDTLHLVNLLARFGTAGSESILFLSHWDTRPISDQAFEPEEREIPVPGANDGASGTAVLLQLAEILSNNPAARTVDILLVDGEDYGDFGQGKDVFLGSRYFASNLPPHLDVEFGVLLDMVGDRDLEIFVEGNSNRRAPAVVDRVWNTAQRLGFGDVFRRQVRHTINDDHIPLNDAGIPTIDVIDFDYPYWHTPQDTPDKVSGSSLGVVGTVMTRLIYAKGSGL